MKGDLSTLKKVCKYASVVMFIGEMVFAGLLIATIVLGIASQFSDQAKDLFFTWVDAKAADSLLSTVSSFMVTMIFFILGFLTLWTIHSIMVSVKDEYTPFMIDNAKRTKVLSLAYLGASFLLLLFGSLAGKTVILILLMFFSSVLISVVMYCLTIVFRYGALLQKESDETL